MWSVHIGNFSPVDRDEIEETQPKWYILVSLATVVVLWTLVTSLIKLIRIILKWKYIHFGRYVAKAKLFCRKSLVSVTRAGVFIWESFHPGYHLGNRASPASHINTWKFFTKERVVRRDLGNRASPVDRAHIKRPPGFKLNEKLREG